MLTDITRAVDAFFAVRKREGYTARETAKYIGIPYTTLLERQRNPGDYRINEVIAIAEATRTDPMELLGGIKK